MRIGISVRKMEENYYIPQTYLDYFENDGWQIIPLYPSTDKKIYNQCDGFIVIGGGDIDPKCYGEANLGSKNIQPDLDELDYKIMEYAVNSHKPLLGICRGIQVINVYFKGTLFQDIANHITPEDSPVTWHSIYRVTKGSNYPKKVLVNSFHHQAINGLGNGLQVIYRSEDGIIEMVCHQNLPILAVQFHPEKAPKEAFSQLILQEYKKLFLL